MCGSVEKRTPSFHSTCFCPTGFRPKFFVQSISSNPIRLGLDEMDWTKTGGRKQVGRKVGRMSEVNEVPISSHIWATSSTFKQL